MSQFRNQTRLFTIFKNGQIQKMPFTSHLIWTRPIPDFGLKVHSIRPLSRPCPWTVNGRYLSGANWIISVTRRTVLLRCYFFKGKGGGGKGWYMVKNKILIDIKLQSMLWSIFLRNWKKIIFREMAAGQSY